MDTTNEHTIPQLPTLWETGKPQAIGRWVETAYDDLLRIARRQMRGERPGHTVHIAALVHDAYLRFVELRRIDWRGRGHFFTVAAAVMRRVLIDRARSVQARKRSGKPLRLTLDEEGAAPAVDVLLLDRALQRLAERDDTLSHIAELRYFAGLTVEKTAEALQLAPATVNRQWSLAQAWLYRELREAVA